MKKRFLHKIIESPYRIVNKPNKQTYFLYEIENFGKLVENKLVNAG